MATKTIDLLLNMEAQNGAGVKALANGLKDVEQQANRTRESMEKLSRIGRGLAVTGAAITAPFMLAMKKYIDTAKETEPTSRKILELNKRWEESQVRIGRVTAEVLLPAMEKALDVVDKITAFAEKNPGAVKAALGIGGTLVILGGMLTTAASIVSSIATIQGLAASAGIAGTTSLAGLAPAIASAIAAAAPFLAIAAAVALAAEATRQILNWALGTNTTWADIGTTVKQLLFIAAEGWKTVPSQLTQIYGGIFQNGIQIVQKLAVIVGNYFRETWRAILSGAQGIITGIGQYLLGLARSFVDGLGNLGRSIMGGINYLVRALIPGRASGGYASNGLYRLGEGGSREFVMSGGTTRAAEKMIGGNLTQQRLLQAIGRSANVYQSMRFSGEIGAADKREVRRIARQSAMDGIAEMFGAA